MKFKFLFALLPLYIFLTHGVFVEPSFAASPCLTDLDIAPDLGDYLDCAIPNIFSAFKTILVATAIIFTLLLIYRMLTNTTNSKIMEEIPTRWLYLLVFIVLIVGGGSALNIILKFFGFGGVDPWLQIINNLIMKL